MDNRFLVDAPSRGRREGLLRAAKSARRPGGRELRPLPAGNPHSPKSPERRFAFVRAELLPPLSAGGPPCRAGRHLHKPCRIPVRRARAGQALTDAPSKTQIAQARLAVGLLAILL